MALALIYRLSRALDCLPVTSLRNSGKTSELLSGPAEMVCRSKIISGLIDPRTLILQQRLLRIARITAKLCTHGLNRFRSKIICIMVMSFPDSGIIDVPGSLATDLVRAAEYLPLYDNKEYYSTTLQTLVAESIRERCS